MELALKVRRLERSVAATGRALVAFSGGVDSSFLAEVAHRTLGRHSLAVTADSPSLKRSELAEATELARERGWNHIVVSTDELTDDRYASNPTNRCYWCKSALMDRLQPFADEGWTIMLGTNLDDLEDHRPGQAAATAAGAAHPMAAAGLTKQDVRQAAAAMGLRTHDKPSQACMASRIAYGVRVTAESLRRVERAEEAMIAMGYEVVRVRDLGSDTCRVEVDPSMVALAAGDLERIHAAMAAAGFASSEVDPRGYRMGAMNELLTVGRGPGGA